jgi:hypothetical protein
MTFNSGDRVVTLDDRSGVIDEVVRRGTETVYFLMLDDEEGAITDGPFLEDELRPVDDKTQEA